MVNKIVYDYLSRFGRQYNLDDLKEKIISKGYPEKEIEEVIRMLNLRKSLRGSRKETRKGFRWMKFAGISGLFLMIFLSAVLAYIYLLYAGYVKLSLSALSSFSMIFFFGFLLAAVFKIFFNYGFVRLGKNTDSRMLKSSSKFFIFLIVLLLVPLLILSVLYLSFPVLKERLINSFINQSDLLFKYFWISILIISGILIINMILFFSGLAGLEKETKFSVLSAVFGWFFIISLVSLIFLSCYLSGYPYIYISLYKISISSIGNYLVILGFVTGLIGVFTLLFESLTLFKMSERFEGFNAY